ncbi:hypothetical protein QAD02_019525 [Eretmocerus hayati]|uniref:Uncharacterized protein n=1 Tax=Eretmocerus hayati TaxID=131215 RepID=A0ACC2PKX7_9HYME|nr:hypothetical protein QAD02_019525 [Eretmocerus hayati]
MSVHWKKFSDKGQKAGETYDFKWTIDTKFVRQKGSGEHVLSRSFREYRLNSKRTWQLRLQSKGPNSPPQLILDLIKPIRWTLQAVVTTRLFCNSKEVRSIVKTCKFRKKSSPLLVQQCVIGLIIDDNIDCIACKISEVQYIRPAKTTCTKQETDASIAMQSTASNSDSSEQSSIRRFPRHRIIFDDDQDDDLWDQWDPPPPPRRRFKASRLKSPPIREKSEISSRNVCLDGLTSACITSKMPITGTDVVECHNANKGTNRQVRPLTMSQQCADLPFLNLDLGVSLEVMKKLLLTGHHSDITLITQDGKRVKAHKTILSARSRKFSEMFKDDCSATPSEIQICGISEPSLKQVMEYIYTANVSNLDNNIIDLYRSSQTYELHSLRDLCIQNFKAKLDIDNAADILIISDESSLIPLKKDVIEFINQHVQRILDSPNFQKMSRSHPTLVVELYFALGKNL